MLMTIPDSNTTHLCVLGSLNTLKYLKSWVLNSAFYFFFSFFLRHNLPTVSVGWTQTCAYLLASPPEYMYSHLCMLDA